MNEELYQLAQQLEQLLFEKNLKLVVAESCTGGLVAEVITAVPGSSACFDRGFVTYSNESKVELLRVNPKTLETYGAVSENTAREMAEGALLQAQGHAQVSLAITGIAGPGGATAEKPVGTICFAWKFNNLQVASETKHFSGERDAVRRQAVSFILQKLISLCKQN